MFPTGDEAEGAVMGSDLRVLIRRVHGRRTEGTVRLTPYQC